MQSSVECNQGIGLQLAHTALPLIAAFHFGARSQSRFSPRKQGNADFADDLDLGLGGKAAVAILLRHTVAFNLGAAGVLNGRTSPPIG